MFYRKEDFRKSCRNQKIQMFPSKHSSWWRRLQDVFKASCKKVFKTFSRRLQDVLKMSSKHLQDVLQRCLQDVFKRYYQVKLFLLTQFQDVFETYSKHFWEVLLRRLSKRGGLPRSHFWEICGQWPKFARVIKVSQVLVFHFTTPFSACLQKRIYNLVEHLH